DISLKEIDPSLNANSSLARIDDAIKNFIGKDLLFGEDMQAAYSEDSIRDIVESEKTLSLLSRLAKGDERVAFLLEKYGIPPDEARVSAENAIAEAKRRAERSVEAAHVGALATEQTRRRLARGEKIEVTEKPRERITLKKAKPKRKEAPLFAVRARGMPSDVRETEVVVGGVRRKERRSIPPGVGPEAVTITTEDVEKELQKLAKDDRPVSDSDAENYTATEDFYSLVWNAFTVSEKGAASYDLLVPTEGMVIGPEGAKQNAKKALESLLPDGPNLYSLEYYEQEKMIGDKSLHNLKEEIAKRIGKKVEDIVAVSPAQTYVVRGKPPRKNIVMLERDDKGEIVVDEEGSPKFVLRDIKKSEVTQLPTRLMLYDNNDQLLLEQMVDDQRNIELASSLNSLKRRYGLVKDIPMAELARIAREFSISSRFVGAVTRRGRVSWVKLEAADLSEKQLRDQIEGSVWFKIAEGQSMSNYMTLDSLGARYNDLIKLEGMTVERAWDLALAQQIENIQKEASIRYDQIIATNELLISNIENTTGELTEDEVREAQRELDNTLKESEAIFTKDTIAKITALAQENKSFIIDPENLDHSLPIPKGAEVNVTAVYKSLRNSISQGKNSFYGEGRLDETQETFLSRASTIPRTPKEITPGTKVSLVPAAWRNIYKTDSRVRNASKDVLRILTALERISDYRKTFGIKDAYRTTDGKVVRIKDKASAISREEDALNKKLEAAKDKLTSVVGEVIGKEFTVEGRKNGMYKLYDESSMEGVDQPVPEDQIIVRKYSQQGLNRVRMNEVYALNKKADDIAKRGTRDLPTKLAKLRQAKDKVQEELNVRLDAVTLQESQEEITPAEAEREREKIRGEFTWRVYEELKDLTHAGRPFISLPKEIRTRVESKEITYKQGVREYIRSIKERWSETRIARVARLRREKLEDEDFFLISSLQRITGKWFNRKEMEQLGLWDQVKEIGASLKAGPQIRGINAVNIYEALKERHTLLQGSRRTRLEVRPETFEGRQLPTEWNEGKYWTFVKSADEIVLPEKPRFLNKWVKAVPRQRWKNAYGVIIDKITITYRPSGAEAEETLDIYEVTDPFLPNP
ncbi:hypothetical protein KAR91_71255, partial [Candidatus Pacearchaeota archaeon]|nr:hypothetical protein [Candidatus Pacearchaeota archaeon]